ncbi:MAG: hypothetical protein JKY43_10725, partial [Phycisphaerales bacterium]|nr:hypothetical protein [Phycisphaerales bacterium]
MDTKILVGGVVGLGLIGIAGILILGGDGRGAGLSPVGGAGSEGLVFDDGASAYALAEDVGEDVVEIELGDIEPARGGR